jgi:hypothetical protein
MLTTPQYAICCSDGTATETELRINGPAVTEPNRLRMTAGCLMREIGTAFGFDIGHYRPDEPWVVFINNIYANVWATKKLKHILLNVYKFLLTK